MIYYEQRPRVTGEEKNRIGAQGVTMPLSIKHVGSYAGVNKEKLCRMVGTALHLSVTETRLLAYYAEQSSGFAPAKKLIAAQLGVNVSTILRNRNKLAKHGCIAVTGTALYLDWDRLRLFSTLDPRYTGKNAKIAPVIPPYKRKHTHGDKRRYHDMEEVPYNTLMQWYNLPGWTA